MQLTLSSSSSVLAVDSTDGRFYLKGVSAGSREVEITAAVTRLFPNHTPDFVRENKELQAFVTREFEERREGVDRIAMVKALAELQKESISHLNDLIAAKVPSLRVDDLEETLRSWCEDDTFAKASGRLITNFRSMVPELIAMAQDLAKDKLPSCLVHGDFASRNVCYKRLEDGSECVILHDWEYAVIGHPFFEFHVAMAHWDEAILVYLELWTELKALKESEKATKELGCLDG